MPHQRIELHAGRDRDAMVANGLLGRFRVVELSLGLMSRV